MQLTQFLDSWLAKGGAGFAFKSAKCKTLFKLVISRIKLLRNKREIQIKQMRRDLAQLLQNGQEATAYIRVEHIAREQNILAAYDQLELFSELILARLPIIESQRECPIDMRTAIGSIIFAAPRCTDLTEFLEIRNMFAAKYGKEFVACAAELRPDCGVDQAIIEKLSILPPTREIKVKLMKEIAEENDVDWDDSSTEAAAFKPPEDLLDGSNQFVGTSQIPIAGSKKKVSPDYEAMEVSKKGSVQDTLQSDDVLDLPSPPKTDVSSLRRGGMMEDPVLSTVSETDLVEDSFCSNGKLDTTLPLSPNTDKNQFIPFLVPVEDQTKPLPKTVHDGLKPDLSRREAPNRKHKEKNVLQDTDLQDAIEAAQAAAESAEKAAHVARTAAEVVKLKMLQGNSSQIDSNDNELVTKTRFGREDHQALPFREAFGRENKEDDAKLPKTSTKISTFKDRVETLHVERAETNDIFDVNLDAVEARKAMQEEKHERMHSLSDDKHEEQRKSVSDTLKDRVETLHVERAETNDIFDVNLDAVEARKAMQEEQHERMHSLSDDKHEERRKSVSDLDHQVSNMFNQKQNDITYIHSDVHNVFSSGVGNKEEECKHSLHGYPSFGGLSSSYSSSQLERLPSVGDESDRQNAISSGVGNPFFSNALPSFDGSSHGANPLSSSSSSLSQPERLPSFEDDTYYSYPNLFSGSVAH